VLQLLHGWSHVPYLNNQQSPIPDRQYMFTLNFTITDGANVLPPAPETQSLPPVKATAPTDNGQPQIWTDIASGPVNTPLTISGRNLPAGAIDLQWASISGNRVVNGYAESTTALAKPTVAADGTLTYQFTAPDDLGGVHRIDAIVNGKVVATTQYIVQPSVAAVENARGPAGTVALFHLKGVGWTETANIYTLVYDNDYIGFACGFNSQGDVQVYLPITGAPGWHYVDLYPAIYKGTDIKGADNFRIPQLTFATDHPNEKLPAFHFAVYVTGGSSQ
jgi:hypothetical protein